MEKKANVNGSLNLLLNIGGRLLKISFALKDFGECVVDWVGLVSRGCRINATSILIIKIFF